MGDGPHGVQHVHLLVADLLRVERNRRLHGHQAEELQEVVLHHVAQCPRVVVVAAAMFHADFLGHRDGDVVHVAAVPDGLEEHVGETESEDVLHGLLAQVMVDAEDLRFAEVVGEQAIQLAGRIEIASQRLFHNDMAAIGLLREARFAQPAGDDAEQRRRRGEIKEAIGLGVPLGIDLVQLVGQLGVGRRVVELGPLVSHRRHEAVPVRVGRRPAARSGRRRRGAAPAASRRWFPPGPRRAGQRAGAGSCRDAD